MKYLIIILFIIFLSLFIKNNNLTCNLTCNKDEIIKKLTRQTARWTIAAQQDKSPLIQNLHISYAMGYLYALLEVASRHEIEKVMKIDMNKFETDLNKIRDTITRNLVKVCPQFTGDINLYLAKVAGNV